jgi:exosortase K
MTSSRKKLLTILRQNGLPYLLGITAAVALKYHYSVADAEALLWMLSPVARLVGFFSTIQFQWELYSGFVSLSHEIRIAPACAGINFMIICFSALFFPLVHRLPGRTVKISWLWLSLAVAYLATLLTNTARILISIELYGASIYGEWITPERIHRLTGTAIFLVVLVIVYLTAERLTSSPPVSGPLTKEKNRLFSPAVLIAPLACYVTVTVVVPLLNGAYGRHGSPSAEHLLPVIGLSLTVLFVFALPGLLYRLIHKKGLTSRAKKTRTREAGS